MKQLRWAKEILFLNVVVGCLVEGSTMTAPVVIKLNFCLCVLMWL